MLKWNDILSFAKTKNGNPDSVSKMVKTDAEWQAQLSEAEYYVTRKAGTEHAFSSSMCTSFEPGVYACICCGTLLFDAAVKFNSGTGWPSFTQPLHNNAIAYHTDNSLFTSRVETRCNVCDAHLGHVFPDGSPPSGLRYCINAVALKKVTQEDTT